MFCVFYDICQIYNELVFLCQILKSYVLISIYLDKLNLQNKNARENSNTKIPIYILSIVLGLVLFVLIPFTAEPAGLDHPKFCRQTLNWMRNKVRQKIGFL
jgi:hypothetical protein